MFLIGSAVPEGRAARRHADPRNLNLAQQRYLMNLPCSARLCSKLRAPHRSMSLGPFVRRGRAMVSNGCV